MLGEDLHLSCPCLTHQCNVQFSARYITEEIIPICEIAMLMLISIEYVILHELPEVVLVSEFASTVDCLVSP